MTSAFILLFRTATHSNVVHLLKECGPSPSLLVSSNAQCLSSDSISQPLGYAAEVIETKESFTAFKHEVQETRYLKLILF